MAAAVDPLLFTTRFVAAGLTLLLAAWLLRLRFTDPVHRAFALVLVLLALKNIAFRLQEILDSPYWGGVAGYFTLAVVPALVYFLVVYAGPRRLAAARARWLILVAGAAVVVAYALDHCLYLCPSPSGLSIGPLGVLASSTAPVAALVGLVLAAQFARSGEGPAKEGLFLTSAALVAFALIETSVALGILVRSGSSGFEGLAAAFPSPAFALGVTLLALPLCAAAFGLYAVGARGAARRRKLAAAGLVCLAVAATGLGVGLYPATAATAGNLLLGLWQLLLPALVVYALVRHQFFDLDVKLKWTMKQSTVAAVFVGVFFVVSESAQTFFQTSGLESYLGIAAAGVLVFAMAPLQQFAERLAHTAMPHVRDPRSTPPAERAATFRAAVEMALSDGVVSRADEQALRRLASS